VSRLRTVVCGTTFGQFYLEAVATLPGEIELAGVLAKGSPRSAACARRYGVPLYTDPGELPGDIDLACVVLRSSVLGGAGTDLALRLLRRGIHVLHEQPVHHDDLVTCLREARAAGARFRVADLYPRLPSVRRFTAAAGALLARQPAEYVDAACAVQVAFPMLHLLGDALGSLRPWQVAAANDADGPVRVLTGRIAGAPFTLRVHNEVDPDDPDNHLPLLHRATIGTAGGTLTLTDTHGPVTWTPRLHIPEAAKEGFDLTAAQLLEPATTVLGPAGQASYRRILAAQWPEAIGADLRAIRAAILAEPGAGRPDQYHLTLSRMWQDVTAELGYPALRPGQIHQPVPLAGLAAAAGGGDTATTVTLYDVAARALEAAEVHARDLTRDQVRRFTERLDEAVLASMLLALQGPGPLDGTLPEILAGALVAPEHHWLVERWLAALTARGLVRADGERFRADRVDEAGVGRAWDLAAESWTGLGPCEFAGYLRANADQLPRLLTGEQRAALMLFPEGRSGLADVVYRDNVTARYLNTAVAAAVRAIAAARTEPPRIVEIGAGTGATTDAVVAALPGGADYLFTDVSRFFLSTAGERFEAFPWLRCGLFDIDRDTAAQDVPPGRADVVIAAGVLNNARDTGAAVRNLAALLAPGGWLLVTEPTHEHLEILASQAFMMTRPSDERAASGRLFLSRRQWLDVLRDAGFDDILTLPGEDHVLAPLGQRLFASRIPPC
jgi:thiazolinyl imide reductase